MLAAAARRRRSPPPATLHARSRPLTHLCSCAFRAARHAGEGGVDAAGWRLRRGAARRQHQPGPHDDKSGAERAGRAAAVAAVLALQSLVQLLL